MRQEFMRRPLGEMLSRFKMQLQHGLDLEWVDWEKDSSFAFQSGLEFSILAAIEAIESASTLVKTVRVT